MKKILALILLLTLCIGSFVSCSLFHEHISGRWEYNETHHYKIVSCSWNRCKIDPYIGEHSFDGNICTICGYERTANDA